MDHLHRFISYSKKYTKYERRKGENFEMRKNTNSLLKM